MRKHGHFNEKNELVDTDGVCNDCGKTYSLFSPCDCDLDDMDVERAKEVVDGQMVVAVVTTFEMNQEVIATTSLREVMKESSSLSMYLKEKPETRPVCGYQSPEPDFLFGEDESIGVNFFVVDKSNVVDRPAQVPKPPERKPMNFVFSVAQRREAYQLVFNYLNHDSLPTLTPGQVRDLYLDNFPWLKDSEEAQRLREEVENTPYYLLESTITGK